MSVDAEPNTSVEFSRRTAMEYLRKRCPNLHIDLDFLGLHDQLGATPAERVSPDTRITVPVRLTGRWAVIGPATLPGVAQSPCADCLGRRWQALRPEEERFVLEWHGRQMNQIGPMPYLTGYALEIAGELCDRLAAEVGTELPGGKGTVYQLSLDDLQVRRYPLVPDPTCPRCGQPRVDSAEAAVIRLESRAKPDPDVYRVREVRGWDIDVAAYANPVCGVLGNGAFFAYESPTTAPVTGVMRMRGIFGFHEFFWSGHADQFDVSRSLAVFEGLERNAGLHPRDLVGVTFDSYRNLVETALDPRECGVYRDEYYEKWSVHRPFDVDTKMRWVWGYSLRDERSILVPEQIVYYGSGVLGGHETFVMECSNGCATGSCLEEAVLFGMLELIERDAFLLCWYGNAELPEIDPSSCASTETRMMVDRMSLFGYDVRLFDNRIDLPVPVVTAVAVRRDGGQGTLCFAAGAGLDPEDAVRAALCEVASYVPEFDRRTDDGFAEARAMAADYSKVLELRHHSLLYGLPEMAKEADFLLGGDRPKRSMAEIYQQWQRIRPRSLDLRNDAHYVRDLLTGAGFDVIVVDQTTQEQRAEGLATACVIVPGLLPIDFGWERQRALHMSRTRTAFRSAGWRSDDLDPSELHYAPHPFP